jgi:hypothetical protein
MTNFLRDLTRVVLLSSDALQTDIQRIQLLQKVKFLLRIFDMNFYIDIQEHGKVKMHEYCFINFPKLTFYLLI